MWGSPYALAVLTVAAGLVLPFVVGRAERRLFAPRDRQFRRSQRAAGGASGSARRTRHLRSRPQPPRRRAGDQRCAHFRRKQGGEPCRASLGGVGLAANMALVAVIAIGGPQVASGTLGGPDLVMLALMGLALFEVVGPLPVAMQTLPGFLASASGYSRSRTGRRRWRPWLAPKTCRRRANSPSRMSASPIRAARNPAVSDVSFTLRPGQRNRDRRAERVGQVEPGDACPALSCRKRRRNPVRGEAFGGLRAGGAAPADRRPGAVGSPLFRDRRRQSSRCGPQAFPGADRAGLRSCGHSRLHRGATAGLR